jgi:hypothetical protein
MSIDSSTKAYIDVFRTSMEEHFRVLKQDLARSNQRCEDLTAEVTTLRRQLAEVKTELANTQTELAEVKQDAADVADDAATDQAASKVTHDKLELRVDDLEQYGRRKSIRVQNVPVVPGEREDSSLVLAQINHKILPTGIVLREKDCIRYHRSSKEKENLDRGVGGNVTQCIVKLKYWSIRRQFQGLNKLMRDKENKVRVFHDLTKRRLKLLNKARDDITLEGWFAYADVNSNLKIRNGTRFFSFNTEKELADVIAKL